MKIFLAALASIVLSVAAQFTLKAGMGSLAVKHALAQPLGLRSAWDILGNAWVLSGFALYLLGAMVWLTVLLLLCFVIITFRLASLQIAQGGLFARRCAHPGTRSCRAMHAASRRK